jgi:hypothetical protein
MFKAIVADMLASPPSNGRARRDHGVDVRAPSLI